MDALADDINTPGHYTDGITLLAFKFVGRTDN